MRRLPGKNSDSAGRTGGRYVDFPEFLDELTAKREELYDSFQGRKQALMDEQQRRAEGLQRVPSGF